MTKNNSYTLGLLTNAFVVFGPLMASFITIFSFHLVAKLQDSHFGDSTDLQAVIGMIIFTIPFTACAYIVGFFPALITAQIFSLQIKHKLKSTPILSKGDFMLYGLTASLLWIIIIIPFAFFINIQTLFYSAVTILPIVIATTLACSWLEWRSYKKIIN